MPRRKVVDTEKLIEAIESGRSSSDIMAEFGFKTLAQLKAVYLDSLVSKGQVEALLGSRRPAAAQPEKNNEIQVNKRGSLIVPREMIERMGFAEGTTFTVRKTLAGVSLKRS